MVVLPKQVLPPLEYDGVTIMVAIIGALVVIKVVNEVISPLPDAGSPIEVVLFVQLNVVPTIVPLKLISVVEVPTQFV